MFDETPLRFIGEFLVTLPPWAARLILAAFTLVLIYLLRRFMLSIIERSIRGLLVRIRLPQVEAIIATLLAPIQFLMVALALYISVQILTPDVQTTRFITTLTRSIVIVSGIVALFRILEILLLESRRLSSILGFTVEERLLPVLRTGVRIIIFVIAVIILMGEWGVNVSGLIASLGIVGLAFSLAAQDTVSNLFGFSMIVGDRPFLLGEFIRVGEIEGTVEKIGVRSTRIRKPDRGMITVPNSILASSAVERFMRRRIQFTLGVSYATTADQMETLLVTLRDMLSQREQVVQETVAVYFTEFGDSALNIIIRCDVTSRDWRELLIEREQVNLAVMRIVADMGLSIAFPTQSIYIESLPKNLNLAPLSPRPDD